MDEVKRYRLRYADNLGRSPLRRANIAGEASHHPLTS